MADLHVADVLDAHRGAVGAAHHHLADILGGFAADRVRGHS